MVKLRIIKACADNGHDTIRSADTRLASAHVYQRLGWQELLQGDVSGTTSYQAVHVPHHVARKAEKPSCDGDSR